MTQLVRFKSTCYKCLKEQLSEWERVPVDKVPVAPLPDGWHSDGLGGTVCGDCFKEPSNLDVLNEVLKRKEELLELKKFGRFVVAFPERMAKQLDTPFKSCDISTLFNTLADRVLEVQGCDSVVLHTGDSIEVLPLAKIPIRDLFGYGWPLGVTGSLEDRVKALEEAEVRRSQAPGK